MSRSGNAGLSSVQMDNPADIWQECENDLNCQENIVKLLTIAMQMCYTDTAKEGDALRRHENGNPHYGVK